MTDITSSSRASAAQPLRFASRMKTLGRRARAVTQDETGAATAEYAIATMAAVAFAGLLVAIMRSDEVKQILTDLIERALSVP